MVSEAIDITKKIATKDKDGDDGGDGIIESVEIQFVNNGYVLKITCHDGEEMTEVYHNLEDVFESIRNLG